MQWHDVQLLLAKNIIVVESTVHGMVMYSATNNHNLPLHAVGC